MSDFDKSMNNIEQGRKAAGRSTPFTLAVVVSVVAVIALLAWRLWHA